MAPSGSTKCMRQEHTRKEEGKSKECEDITREEVYRDLWRVSISSEYRKVVGRLSGRYAGDRDKCSLKGPTKERSGDTSSTNRRIAIIPGLILRQYQPSLMISLLSKVRSKRTSCCSAQTPRRETTINVIADETNNNGDHEWQMDRQMVKGNEKKVPISSYFQFKVMQIRCSADGQGVPINEQRHREPGNLRAFHLIEYCRLSCCCRSCVADASASSPMYSCTFLSLATDSSPGSSGNKGDGERELHRYVTDYLTVDGRQP
ncbi:hypothetical protein G5I_00128 [Acromyrmex echinatior]|uniref:Uncharacterized protein n=1 Tax=Acromyrmex echinatior TaxID=103372 RepID=F4W423_ACREC|nr:hypothetical protein G5I_00128 [Acromyrmex echinatior]